MKTENELREAVKGRFAAVADLPAQAQKFPLGAASARRLGYDPREINALPPSVTESFCGVGNPLGQGRAILGVVDGASPKGVEGEDDIRWRKDFLRQTGCKL